MKNNFIELTQDNLEQEHVCCIIRAKRGHAGVDGKKDWLHNQLTKGHIFRKLDEKACVFIEYAPLENAWVPVVGDNYLYLYCLWVESKQKGNGYGQALMETCIEEAKRLKKSGICMLGSLKQKSWLSDQNFAKKQGFEVVEESENGYQLLALSLDGSVPHFGKNVKKMAIDQEALTIYYSPQCPYVEQILKKVKESCEGEGIELVVHKITSLEEAKNLPCVFNNYAAFYQRKFITVNPLDFKTIQRMVSQPK